MPDLSEIQSDADCRNRISEIKRLRKYLEELSLRTLMIPRELEYNQKNNEIDKCIELANENETVVESIEETLNRLTLLEEMVSEYLDI